MTAGLATELLLGARDETPQLCGLCARPASPVGVIHPPGQNVLWLCPLCNVRDALEVSAMNPARLSELEAAAIAEASASLAGEAADAVLETLWAQGIRDLDALDAARRDAAVAALAAAPAWQKTLRRAFLAYTIAIRRILANAGPA